MSDFERHRQSLLREKLDTGGDGWRAEVRKYLKTLEVEVSPKTDIVRWWQVHFSRVPSPSHAHFGILTSRIMSMSILRWRGWPLISFLSKRHPSLVSVCSRQASK
jgi:hypothetical protein